MRLNLIVVATVVLFFLLGGSISSVSKMATAALLVLVGILVFYLAKSHWGKDTN